MSHSEWLSERRTNWPNGRMAERSLAKAYSHKQTELKNAKLPTLVVVFFLPSPQRMPAAGRRACYGCCAHALPATEESGNGRFVSCTVEERCNSWQLFSLKRGTAAKSRLKDNCFTFRETNVAKVTIHHVAAWANALYNCSHMLLPVKNHKILWAFWSFAKIYEYRLCIRICFCFISILALLYFNFCAGYSAVACMMCVRHVVVVGKF